MPESAIPLGWEHHRDGLTTREIAGMRARNLRRLLTLSDQQRRAFFAEMIREYGDEARQAVTDTMNAADDGPPESDCAICGTAAGMPCKATCETQFGPAYDGPTERPATDTVTGVTSYPVREGEGMLLTVHMKDGRELDHFTFEPIPVVMWQKVDQRRIEQHPELKEAMQFAYDIRGARPC